MRPEDCRILIVENYPDAAETCGVLLRMAGLQVLATHDGGALGACRGFAPHVALIDLGSPGMTERIIANSARELFGEGALLISVSAWTGDEDLAMRSGFDLHYAKPMDPKALLEVLKSHCASLTT